MKGWLIKELLTCLLIISALQFVNAANNLTGTITTVDGTPIEGAYVAPVTTFIGIPTQTDLNGRFSISLSSSVKYLIAYYDDNSTPGWDYVPAKISLEEAIKGNITIQLQPAASISLTWELQYVESEKLAEDVTITVLNEKGETLAPTGLPLIYEKYPKYEKYSITQLHIPRLDPSTIIVPIGTPTIKVWSVVSKYITKTFTFQPQQPLQQGEQAEYDIRQFTIPENQQYVENLIQETKQEYTKIQENGFYLTKQKNNIITTETQLTKSITQYIEGDYEASYKTLKNTYINIRQTKQNLQTLLNDATQSIYIILAFLALSSVIAGTMITENNILKTVISLIIFTASTTILYLVYPASKANPFNTYLEASLISITASNILSLLTERLLARVSSGSKVRLRAVILPIFSISKRFLKRRRTRFILTTASVTLLVMSFVVLTSFSEEYGVNLSRVMWSSSQDIKVMVNAYQSPTEDVSFLNLMNEEQDWLSNLPGLEIQASKYINYPSLSPLFSIGYAANSLPIYGVIGINAENEAKLTELDDALLKGTLPRRGEVALSSNAVDELGAKIGDTLTISRNKYVLSGVLNDWTLLFMKEPDGGYYLPYKLVSSGPTSKSLDTCLPIETVIMDSFDASKIRGAGLYRITLGLKIGEDADTLAERIALEMGYIATSASPKGSTTYLLGSYIEGKGLPLIIPWSIVVLNVVATMINSLYERRKEINILSSVGLNPSHIAGVFISEASIIGFTAGGLGYLTGLCLYRLMPIFGLAFEVQQKVSAFWSLASVVIALSAVLVGVSVALRSSVVITPSLLRRWVMDLKREGDKPFETVIPVKLDEKYLSEFIEFSVGYLEALQNEPTRKTSMIRFDADRKAITFGYSSYPPTAFYTGNTLIIEPEVDGTCSIRLQVRGGADHAYEAASLVRQMIMEWSNREKKNNS